MSDEDADRMVDDNLRRLPCWTEDEFGAYENFDPDELGHLRQRDVIKACEIALRKTKER